VRLIVITPEQTISGETDIVNSLFHEGMEWLHVRKPDLDRQDLRKYIEAIDQRFHDRIVIHGYFELCIEYGLGGIHFNSRMRASADFAKNAMLAPANKISTSFHSWDEIADNEFGYGCVFISPVFDSISKAGYGAGIDLAGAREIKRKLSAQKKYCPEIIGLGGVGAGQIRMLHEYGFDGAAALGGVWLATDPVAAFSAINAQVKLLRR